MRNSTLPSLKITLFIPCFVDMCYPRVGISIVQILERLGHSVDYREELTCCGQPAFNSGYWDEARPTRGVESPKGLRGGRNRIWLVRAMIKTCPELREDRAFPDATALAAKR